MRRSFRVNGTLSDTVLMAIRRDEWEAGKEGRP
jgi:RimJ/RimL family protein N-acetyltransferase